jgi:hypothetical protein
VVLSKLRHGFSAIKARSTKLVEARAVTRGPATTPLWRLAETSTTRSIPRRLSPFNALTEGKNVMSFNTILAPIKISPGNSDTFDFPAITSLSNGSFAVTHDVIDYVDTTQLVSEVFNGQGQLVQEAFATPLPHFAEGGPDIVALSGGGYASGGDGDVSINWSRSLNLPVGGDDISAATAGSLTVADSSSIGGTLTLLGETLALNGDTAIVALTEVGGTLPGAGAVTVAGQATFALPFTILHATGKRFPSKARLRGEPPCR